jgi:hypothetical protein
MGIEAVVSGARLLEEAMADLATDEIVIVMVDGQLVSPAAAPPQRWHEVRLRSQAGMVTVMRRGEAVAVVVFGNATPELLELQRRVAAAFSITGGD